MVNKIKDIMNKYVIIIFCLFLNSCQQRIPNYSQGYIYDKELNPLYNIKIENPYDSTIYTLTNKSGYFKIDQSMLAEYLYIIKNNKKVDSIYISTRHPEGRISYSFVEGRNDTLFIDIKKLDIK